MDIITNLSDNTKQFHISLKIYEDDHSDFLVRELPIPNLHTHLRNGYSMTYFLKGFNGTNKVNEYYLDTQNRIMTSLSDLDYELTEHPILMDTTHKYFEKIYEFKDFGHLDKSKSQKYIDQSKEVRTLDKDTLFEIVRQDSYEMKRNGTLSYERVFDLCNYYNQKLHIGKSHSDIRSKSKSIYEWTRDIYRVGSGNTDRTDYFKKYNKLNRGWTMTKSEHLENLIDKKRMGTQKKILEGVKILKEQKKKITMTNICEVVGLNKNTMTKYKDFFLSIK